MTYLIHIDINSTNEYPSNRTYYILYKSTLEHILPPLNNLLVNLIVIYTTHKIKSLIKTILLRYIIPIKYYDLMYHKNKTNKK